MSAIHIITPEYLPKHGGVGDYTRHVARGLADAGDEVHVWCPATGEAQPGDRFSLHSNLGTFSRRDLATAGRLLDSYPSPRRILVQWVPHGYGCKSMNVAFCLWLWKRSLSGDEIQLMVHEPFLAFDGRLRQTAAAAVHRLMTMMLLRSTRTVWVSIPAWAEMWKPFTFGRSVSFDWLPVPSVVPQPEPAAIAAVRARLGADARPIVGHLGTYGWLVTSLLDGVLPKILRAANDAQLLLIGSGSEAFAKAFLSKHREYAGRVTATGVINDAALAAHVAACDVLIQPYPDGVSSRRTTVMAGLRLGVPIVTTRGALTESLWGDSDAVRLTDVGDEEGSVTGVVELLQSADLRRRRAATGRELYARTFDVGRTIDALHAVRSGAAS